MTTLTTGDLRGAVDAIGDWHAAATLEELETVAIERLHTLIPSDGVGWNEIDLAAHKSRVLTSPVDYLVPARLDVMNEFIHEHPNVRYVAETGDPSAMKVSDFLSVRELRRLNLYEHFFAPLGIEDLLAVIVQAKPVIVGIAFTRGRRSFTERDRALLNLLRPQLELAFTRALERAEAQERLDLLDRGLYGRQVVRLDADGRPLERSAVLERWFGTEPTTVAAGVYVREDAELVVRRADGEPPLLLLDERTLCPDPRRVRDFALTRRETEIVTLVARGLTDAQIALELSVSARTVAKHLQHVYEKLGVNTRHEAVALLVG